MAAELTRDEVLRYSRHLTLPDVGVEGQQRLKAARVLCIGAGGLGSPAAMYLAAAGVGTIGLVDDDVVDVSNLQRQIIHGTSDVGRSKLESASDRLREINPHTRIEPHDVRFGERNALDLVSAYDVIVDGTDNFPDALSRQRCLRPCGPSECLRQHLALRRPGVGLRRAATARAIAVYIPSRPRQASSRAAPKAECSACFRVSSERFKRPRRSS